jgi:arylsulfatase A-like enzyme/tetratricopeptide (TPR) repeat protein
MRLLFLPLEIGGMRILGYLLGAMWLAGFFSAHASSPLTTPVSHPNIVLITLDTTRADRMGFLGSERGLTPNLDALARQAIVFSHAYAQVPLTTPSHAAILSGTYPQFNHVNYMGDPLDKGVPFLPDILHHRGYRTAAFVGALVLDSKKLAPGFERGFDVYDADYHRRHPGEDNYHSIERRGGDVVGRALAWLSKRPSAPFFLWVHLYDPHDPYSPPEPYKARYQNDLYDGEIAYADAAISKLLAALKTKGLFDSALIAVMADHGEAFGEHGEKHHGIFLYDETIHVPLLIKMPRQRLARKVVNPVGLVDVAPTILQAVKLPVPGAMQGESLLSLMRSDQPPSTGEDSNFTRPVYSESAYGHLSFGWSKLRSWRTGKYLYIEAPDRELYNQSVDVQAVHNLASDSKAVADTAAAQVSEFVRKTEGGGGEKTKLSFEQTENLHALGYMSSSSDSVSDSDDQSGPDPKQRIATANLYYEALVDVENARYDESVPILEQVIKQEPNTPSAYLQLGQAYMALKEYDKAVAPFERLVAKKPDDAFAHYELGCALVKTGHWAEAAPQFEAAVSQMTSSSMMHFYLALVYQRTARSEEAETEFQNAVRLDSNNFPANLLLGRMFVMQQKAEDGLPYLKKAAKLHLDAIDPHRIMADAYVQLGRQADANQEIMEAERIQAEGGSRLGTSTETDASTDVTPR